MSASTPRRRKGFRLGGVNDPLNLPLCSPRRTRALFGGFQAYERRETVELRAWRPRPAARPQFLRRRLLHRHLQSAGDARRRLLLVAHRVQRAQGAHDGRRVGAVGVAGSGPRSVDQRQRGRARSSIRLCPGVLAATTGIRDGNRLPTVPNFQISASASYTFPVATDAERLCRRLLPACRQPLHPAERPGEQSAQLRFRPALRRRHRQRGDDRRPEAAGLQLRQPQRRGGLGQRARRDALRQQSVRRECAAVVRSRARRAGAAGLQRRPAARHRHHLAQALRH